MMMKRIQATGFFRVMVAGFMAFAAVSLSACNQPRATTEAETAAVFPPLTPVTVYDSSG